MNLCLGIFLFVTAHATDLKIPQLRPFPPASKTLSKFAVGSCLKQKKPAPIFLQVANAKPDLMILLGDNLYADVQTRDELISNYNELYDNADFQMLAASTPVFSIWDDHDYGINDQGTENPIKAESQEVFLSFWNEPKTSIRHKQKGIYAAKIFGPKGKRVQFILLDTRYHRSPLAKASPIPGQFTAYLYDNDTQKTFLGSEQWAWLKNQLKQPAEVRVIGSGIQILNNSHPAEKWGNLPHEHQALLQLLKKTKGKILLLSGDQHFAEWTCLDSDKSICEMTASGLNNAAGPRGKPTAGKTPNPLRVNFDILHNHFGMIEVLWPPKNKTVSIKASVIAEDGKVLFTEIY